LLKLLIVVKVMKPNNILLLLTILLGMLSYANCGINFLTISDFHLNYELRTLMDIDPTGFSDDNDLDSGTFDQISNAIKNYVGEGNLGKNLSFVLCLGDVVGHHIFEDRDTLVKWNEKYIYSELLKMFPDVPIINIFGNNDSFERNYGLYTHNSMSPYGTAIEIGFKNGFLSTGKICNGETDPNAFPCLISQESLHGHFAMKLHPDLMLLGLNTIM